MLAAGALLEPEEVAEAVVRGLADGRFLILPHPEVAEFERRRAADRDRWLAGRHAPGAGPAGWLSDRTGAGGRMQDEMAGGRSLGGVLAGTGAGVPGLLAPRGPDRATRAHPARA